jgi:hypothetical protein
MTESVNPAKGSRPRIQLGNREYVGSYRICLADSPQDGSVQIEFPALLWTEKGEGMMMTWLFCGPRELTSKISGRVGVDFAPL